MDAVNSGHRKRWGFTLHPHLCFFKQLHCWQHSHVGLFSLSCPADQLASLLWSPEAEAINWNWQFPGFTHPGGSEMPGGLWLVRLESGVQPRTNQKWPGSHCHVAFFVSHVVRLGAREQWTFKKKAWLNSRWPLEPESWRQNKTKQNFASILPSEKKDRVDRWRKAGYGSEGNKLSLCWQKESSLCLFSKYFGEKES